MTNLYFYLDMRNCSARGAGSLKLAVSHKRKTSYESLGIFLKPEEWDRDKQQVVGRPDKKFQNVLLKKRMAECVLALQRVMLRSDMDSLTSKQVLEMVVRGTDTVDDLRSKDYFMPVYNEYCALLAKPSTRASYRSTLANITEFEPDIDTVRFVDINVAWLRRYQQWLTETRGMSVNGANVYLRNLRTVFNYARNNGYTLARYPFKEIDMSTTEPEKRYVTIGKFAKWLTYPVKDNRNMYRDLFMLSFYLCGIRPVDLLNVKKSQVEEGRLVYWPEKLNGRKKLSIKIEPEAWEIIHRYEGTEHLINIMDKRTDYRAFCQHWNKAIKAVGPDERTDHVGQKGKVYFTTKHHGVIPAITRYYSRTLWASFAYNELDVPMDIISQALGHNSGRQVTNFYVKRGEAKVDEVNRRMIDLIKKKAQEIHES